jgi:hypothetical protein
MENQNTPDIIVVQNRDNNREEENDNDILSDNDVENRTDEDSDQDEFAHSRSKIPRLNSNSELKSAKSPDKSNEEEVKFSINIKKNPSRVIYLFKFRI